MTRRRRSKRSEAAEIVERRLDGGALHVDEDLLEALAVEVFQGTTIPLPGAAG